MWGAHDMWDLCYYVGARGSDPMWEMGFHE